MSGSRLLILLVEKLMLPSQLTTSFRGGSVCLSMRTRRRPLVLHCKPVAAPPACL